MTPELNEILIKIHKKGFNISQLLGKLAKIRKERKTTYDIPEEVKIEVCREILKNVENIKQPWPYFMKVLEMKSQEYFANKTMKEAGKNKFRKMPESIKSILKGI